MSAEGNGRLIKNPSIQPATAGFLFPFLTKINVLCS
nr:MAG TPA_asm: hypothetical protein [Caudoviricetes sp.]